MDAEFLIVGAGIAGLSLAHHLTAAGRDVRVLEASDRVGGTIRTLEQDGVRLEQGPQSLRGAGLATARLVRAVGLVDRVVPASADAARRYLLLDDRLQLLPTGPGGLLRGGALRRRSALRALVEPLISREPRAEESLDAFVRRRFGAGIADPVLDAFVAGIYAGDSRQTEARAAFPDLVEAEEEHGSVILGMMRRDRGERPDDLPRGAFTFDTGAEALPRALGASLGERVVLDCPVRTVLPEGDRVRLVHARGESVATHVIVTTPPHVARGQVDAWRPFLDAIPASPVAAIHLGWREGTGPELDGFGWLAPTRERSDVLGAIWVSSTFPHLAPGWDLVRVMVGGSRAPWLAELSERALAAHALDVVRQVQGRVGEPDLVQVAVHRPGIPQYTPGHTRRREAIEGRLPRVHPLGWGLTGIGLSQGLQASETLAERLLQG